MGHPYSALPKKALWRKAVADLSGDSHAELYEPKWPITRQMRISTAGSCFAQHIGHSLRAGGFTVVDAEPPPSVLPTALHSRFGFGIYSARYGNIYTARQMLQLVQEAFGERPQSSHVWEKDGRHYDALRPTIEPNGLSSPEVVCAHRRHHLEMVRHLLLGTDLLIFTLGLTEAWIDTATGTVFPTCPGVTAGEYDVERTVFKNFSYPEVLSDVGALRDLLHRQQIGRRAKILLTVSPIPLTATASGRHVMQATVHSKSILRAAVGEMVSQYDDVDYFPSFEIITNPWRKGTYYEPNFRAVSKLGVDTVMATFMATHGSAEVAEKKPIVPKDTNPVVEPLYNDMTVVCDEELLDAFGAK